MVNEVTSRANDQLSKVKHQRAPLEGCGAAVERQRILSKLLPANGLLLDVGCWDGSFAKYLHKDKYVGVDVNPLALGKARERKIEVVLASCDYLPFRNESFDACSLIEVIEHLYYPGDAVTEINRILKTDGKLILATPNLVNFVDRINMLVGKEIGIDGIGWEHQHIRFFTWKMLNKFLVEHGFELERRETWFLPFPSRTVTRKFRSWRTMMKHLARAFPNFDEGLLGKWTKTNRRMDSFNELKDPIES